MFLVIEDVYYIWCWKKAINIYGDDINLISKAVNQDVEIFIELYQFDKFVKYYNIFILKFSILLQAI